MSQSLHIVNPGSFLMDRFRVVCTPARFGRHLARGFVFLAPSPLSAEASPAFKEAGFASRKVIRSPFVGPGTPPSSSPLVVAAWSGSSRASPAPSPSPSAELGSPRALPVSNSGRVVSRLRFRDLARTGGDEGGDSGSIGSEVLGEGVALELDLRGLKNANIDPRFTGSDFGRSGPTGSRGWSEQADNAEAPDPGVSTLRLFVGASDSVSDCLCRPYVRNGRLRSGRILTSMGLGLRQKLERY